jgi:hypothetical protein
MKELPDRLEPLIIVCGCVESVGLLCSVPQDRGIAVERVQRCRLQSADPTSINNLQSVVSRLDRPRTPGAVGNQGSSGERLTEAGCCHGTDYITSQRGLQALYPALRVLAITLPI